MNIAIIPARSGSKRIKNKNIKLFNNKPIISYVIKTCIESGIFSKIPFIVITKTTLKVQNISNHEHLLIRIILNSKLQNKLFKKFTDLILFW